MALRLFSNSTCHNFWIILLIAFGAFPTSFFLKYRTFLVRNCFHSSWFKKFFWKWLIRLPLPFISNRCGAKMVPRYFLQHNSDIVGVPAKCANLIFEFQYGFNCVIFRMPAYLSESLDFDLTDFSSLI